MNITWKFDDNISDVGFRTWSFTSSDGSGKETLAIIGANGDPTIRNKLPDFDIIKPGTLILNHVDKRYDGTYNFELRVDGKSDDTSDVRVFIAGKFPLSKHLIYFKIINNVFHGWTFQDENNIKTTSTTNFSYT